jgi:hypothetical protein
LLNGVNPLPPTQHEADSFTFSLLNGIPSPPPTKHEADSLTFSLLNGEPPPVGATTYEVDSLNFSLHNLAPSTATRANARQPEHRRKAGAKVALAKP